jgi:hypothetical protein
MLRLAWGDSDFSTTAQNFILTPSPEPSSYAMMLGGLVLLGFCVRRKLA